MSGIWCVIVCFVSNAKSVGGNAFAAEVLSHYAMILVIGLVGIKTNT